MHKIIMIQLIRDVKGQKVSTAIGVIQEMFDELKNNLLYYGLDCNKESVFDCTYSNNVDFVFRDVDGKYICDYYDYENNKMMFDRDVDVDFEDLRNAIVIGGDAHLGKDNYIVELITDY